MKKTISTLAGTAIIVLATIIIFGGVFACQYFSAKPKIIPQSQNQPESWKNYKNSEYGFSLAFPETWKGFAVEKKEWQGWANDGLGEIGKYKGAELVFKNPQTTANQKYQDIPVMVFTHEVWDLVAKEKVAVSAAPIGPAKIGENSKYVFATPPRWYGFTDAIDPNREAVDIVKTFKAF